LPYVSADGSGIKKPFLQKTNPILLSQFKIKSEPILIQKDSLINSF
jgi:hypothetical protein